VAQAPQVDRELKRDALGRVELIEGPDGRAVRRVACGGAIPGSRLVARLLLSRERRALGVLGRMREPDGLERLASLDGTVPRRADVLIRPWIAGTPLHLVQELPRDFFAHLARLVEGLHAAGVCHNDLHKEQNVLVREDGMPEVIDFQLASVHRSRGALFRSRCRDDLRHVEKHRRRYEARGRASTGGGGRRSVVASLWRRLVKPVYNAVTRGLLRTRDGEARRPSAGPWPTWTAPLTAEDEPRGSAPRRGREVTP